MLRSTLETVQFYGWHTEEEVIKNIHGRPHMIPYDPPTPYTRAKSYPPHKSGILPPTTTTTKKDLTPTPPHPTLHH